MSSVGLIVVEDFAVLSAERRSELKRQLLGSAYEATPEFNWPAEQLWDQSLQSKSFALSYAGSFIGVALFQWTPPEAEILAIYLQKDQRGRGLAKVFLQSIFDEMQKISRVFLEVHEKNQGAIYLYKSLGFFKIGYRARYYRDGGGACLMEKVISP